MTSLELQLKRLKSAPGTHHLSVERDHSSLLFDKREAAGHSREEFLKIAKDGLRQLARFDEGFASPGYEPQLFEAEALQMNRGMLAKEKAEELDQALERMLVRLSPYFHHQACKQVLEWLIHKYQVCSGLGLRSWDGRGW